MALTLVFTEEYKRLCHPSPEETSLINECVLRPNICGHGRCIDTQEGYRCECFPGYRKGETEVCEGQSSLYL